MKDWCLPIVTPLKRLRWRYSQTRVSWDFNVLKLFFLRKCLKYGSVLRSNVQECPWSSKDLPSDVLVCLGAPLYVLGVRFGWNQCEMFITCIWMYLSWKRKERLPKEQPNSPWGGPNNEKRLPEIVSINGGNQCPVD